MNTILEHIVNKSRSIAILLDPDKLNIDHLPKLCSKIDASPASFIFVGGSMVQNEITHKIVRKLKTFCSLPIILFPGNINQLTDEADALLFLSLLSGTNPEYLNGQHIKAAPLLQSMNLEVIPTSYILVDGGNLSSTLRVSETNPIQAEDLDRIKNTCLAGQYMGKQLTYLEAGSGAENPIATNTISEIRKVLNHPLIVGGGLRNMDQINKAFDAGANLVVVGTAFEEDPHFFEASTLSNQVYGNH